MNNSFLKRISLSVDQQVMSSEYLSMITVGYQRWLRGCPVAVVAYFYTIVFSSVYDVLCLQYSYICIIIFHIFEHHLAKEDINLQEYLNVRNTLLCNISDDVL